MILRPGMPPTPVQMDPISYDRQQLQRWLYDYLEQCQAVYPGIDETTSETEFQCLYEAASELQQGVVLEIGTGAGFSAVALAAGAPMQLVYTVDPEKPYNGVTQRIWTMRRKIRKAMWRALQLHKRIVFHRTKAAKFQVPGQRGIGLLYIDGDHGEQVGSSKPYALTDYERFEPNVVEDGYIAFHDREEPAVKRTVEQVVRITGQQPQICGQLAVFQKRGRKISQDHALASLQQRAANGFHTEQRVVDAIKQAETLYDGTLQSKQEFLRLIWHDIAASRILTPRPEEPRTLLDVARRMIERELDFALLCSGEAANEIPYEPTWFRRCVEIDAAFDHSRLGWIILVPGKPDERRQSPDGTHYIYDGCHKTLVYAHRLLRDHQGDDYKPVQVLIITPRPGG